MSIINSKENIPTLGDVVEKIIASKDRKFAKITFSSGKSIICSIDPNQFAMKPVDNTNLPPPINKKKVITSGKKVNEMTKNSPEDLDYKNKALATLARLEGKSPQEIEELLQANNSQTVMSESSASGSNDDWKEKAQSVLNKSQERATRLAEQLSKSAGGKTDASFAGKSSISLG
jgi:hypothetical protein